MYQPLAAPSHVLLHRRTLRHVTDWLHWLPCIRHIERNRQGSLVRAMAFGVKGRLLHVGLPTYVRMQARISTATVPMPGPSRNGGSFPGHEKIRHANGEDRTWSNGELERVLTLMVCRQDVNKKG